MANAIVLIVLAVIVFFAVRSLYRKHKNGGGCNGDCGNCGGNHNNNAGDGGNSCCH